MLVLAFDTTSEHGGAALYRDSDCLASAKSDSAAAYSVTLFQMVERLFEEVRRQQAGSRLSLHDIDLFAVANGPGSFTGIRVGLAAAQAWAKVFGRPVAAVSVLEAMVEEAQPETDWALSVLDARRGEFFLGTFRRATAGGGNRFVAQGDGLVLKPEDLGPFLEERLRTGTMVTCLVREHDRPAHALRDSLPRSLRWTDVRGTLLPAIAHLALEAHRKGRVQSPAGLDAYYIRRSDAELKWRE
jgi:tRNA threonylcarbamoyl adenosine modification protein YeaZ